MKDVDVLAVCDRWRDGKTLNPPASEGSELDLDFPLPDDDQLVDEDMGSQSPTDGKSPARFGWSPLDLGFPADNSLTDGPVHSPLDMGFDAEPMVGLEEAVVHSPLDLGFPTEPLQASEGSELDLGFPFPEDDQLVDEHMQPLDEDAEILDLGFPLSDDESLASDVHQGVDMQLPPTPESVNNLTLPNDGESPPRTN